MTACRCAPTGCRSARAERLKEKTATGHPTQSRKLLHRVLIATTNPGDVVLDPFFGTAPPRCRQVVAAISSASNAKKLPQSRR